MNPGTWMALLSILITNVVAVVLAVRLDRKNREGALEATLSRVVDEKFAAIFKTLTSFEKRMTLGERKHERLVGRLEGKGIIPISDEAEGDAK